MAWKILTYLQTDSISLKNTLNIIFSLILDIYTKQAFNLFIQEVLILLPKDLFTNINIDFGFIDTLKNIN